MAKIEVVEVKEGNGLDKFIRLPWQIYAKDPIWVAPLMDSYKKLFDSKVCPFFHHGRMDYFIALMDGKVVGRVAAIANDLHNETWKDKTGFFGFFESIDHQEVANALLEAARQRLEDWGFTHMRGPASPSSNEEYGVQVDGFEHQHVILSTYNAPYYFKLYTGFGLVSIKELYAFRFDGKKILEKNQERIDRLSAALSQRMNFELVDLDMKKFEEGVKTFKGIFNEAWTTNHNHGWVPLTDAEFDFITGDLKQITDPRLVMFAKVNGQVVGGAICLPDYNEIFRSWKGKLFPFNWIDMFTKPKKIKCVRIVILGVLPAYQKKGLDAIMYAEITKRGLARGATWAEASYIVEDNEPMKRPLLNIGGEIYKTYKVMEKPI
jgi:GNAT superfamily N-acetyltransferase